MTHRGGEFQLVTTRDNGESVTLQWGGIVLEVIGNEDGSVTLETHAYDPASFRVVRFDWTQGRGGRELEPGEVSTFTRASR